MLEKEGRVTLSSEKTYHRVNQPHVGFIVSTQVLKTVQGKKKIVKCRLLPVTFSSVLPFLPELKMLILATEYHTLTLMLDLRI